MAKDVITRFKLETTAFDSAIKNASRELANYTKTATQAGNDFQKFTKGNVDAARALGNVATSSTNAKDKVKELVGAYNEAAKAYNSLTKQQQQSDFGKALGQSLTQLKGRIGEAKQELNGGGGLSGALEAVASKFGLNVSQLTKFGVALAAAGAAAKVAKDAFFNNEEQLDEWGRVVQSSQSLYEGFLNALNTGDIGGYLSNINNIVQAARDAYDALDALNTYNAFNQINIEKTRTNMTQAIADYRSGEGTREQAKAAAEAYKNELRERQKMERDAYLAAVKDLAAKRGVNAGDLQKALSGSYGNYRQLKNTPLTGTAERYTPGTMPGQAGTYTQYKVAANERERLGEALRHLNDTELQSLQALGAQAQRTATEVASVDRQMVRMLGKGTSTPGGTGGRGSSTGVKAESISSKYLTGEGINVTESMNELKAQLSYWQKSLADATTSAAAGQAEAMIAKLKEQIDAQPLALRLGISTEEAAELKDKVNAQLEEIAKDIKPIDVNFNTTGAKNLNTIGKETEGTWKDAAGAVGQLGSALQGLEDPSAKVAGIVMQSIANVALSFSKALGESAGPWDWIAAAIAGTAAMVSTISAIHGATGYAEGGQIPGNSFSGDNQLARVNAGEIILNRAQQSNIAGQLTSPVAALADREPFMRTDDIYLGLRTWGRKHGLGDPVFARS